VPRKGDIFIEKVRGSNVTSGIKSTLAGARKGDQIMVTGIDASAPGLGRVKMKPIVLEVI
jgi:hypothetical protein